MNTSWAQKMNTSQEHRVLEEELTESTYEEGELSGSTHQEH